MNARNSMLACFFAGLMVSACSSGDAALMAASSTTPSAPGGSAATLGSAGTSSAGGPAADSDTGAAPVVMCGSASCTAPMPLPAVSAVTPMACCLDAAAAKCGYVVSGTCTPPAPDAPKCPATTIALGKACCTAENICGIDSTAFGGGCRDILPGAKTMCDGTRLMPGGASAGGSAANGGNGGSHAAGSSAAAGSSGSAAPAAVSGAAAGARSSEAGAGGR